MRILSNLILSGRLENKGMFFLPTFFTEEALSGSFLSGSSSSSLLGLYTDPYDPTPKFLDTSSFISSSASGSGGPTKIKCDVTSSVSSPQTLKDFYRCLVSGSSIPTVSNFNMGGISTDSEESEYSGSERRNWSTLNSGSDSDVRITHLSKVSISGSIVNDFIFDFVSGDAKSELTVYVDSYNGWYGPDSTAEEIVERFRKLICRCLKNGQKFTFWLNILNRNSKDRFGRIYVQFEKCYGICKKTLDIVTGVPISNPSVTTGSLIFPSTSGDIIQPFGAMFSYELAVITGSEPSGSEYTGILSSSVTPYLVVPSSQKDPSQFYLFDSMLNDTPLESTPGLIYFNSNTSTLHAYNGSGSWASFTSTGSFTKYTQQIGNATASMFVVSHNKGTRDVMVTVRQTNSPYEIVFPTISATTVNTVSIDFGSSIPNTNEYTVIVI